MTDEGGAPLAVGNRWAIAAAAVVMQICLGVLYAWSVFRPPLADLYHWDKPVTIAPFRYMLLFFTLGMVVAGLWQDRKGPRLVGSCGGILLGLGCILAKFIGNTPTGLVIAYGVIGGLGVGFAYVTPVATCVKWFPDKRGLIVGLAVMGFGAGGLFFAPLLKTLIGIDKSQYATTIPQTFMILGVILFVFVTGAAQLFRVPPPGWKPAGWNPPGTGKIGAGNFATGGMLATWQFYALWVLFAIGSAIGLTAIGECQQFMERLGDPANAKAAAAAATGAVSLLAVFNGLGRLTWGGVSDRLGRKLTVTVMSIVYLIACVAFLRCATAYMPGLIGVCMAGFCLGGFLAIMPATCADYYGQKHFGLNYGLLFSAYGLSGYFVPGLVASVMKGFGKQVAEGYTQVFTTLAIAAAVAILLSLVMKKPSPPEAPETA